MASSNVCAVAGSAAAHAIANAVPARIRIDVQRTVLDIVERDPYFHLNEQQADIFRN
jgi:hypothetical protein